MRSRQMVMATAMAGALLMAALPRQSADEAREALREAMALLPYALAVAAASLIYVAVADLIPGLHRRTDLRASLAQIAWIAVGVGVVMVAESQLH